MAVIADLAIQGAQMTLVLVLAPLLTGFVRKVKARLLRRRGAPLIQPYRDLLRLLRKEVVLADNASWLFRVIPYLIFQLLPHKILQASVIQMFLLLIHRFVPGPIMLFKW